MKLGLINSAWSNSLLDTAKGIHKTKAIGFDTIDIFADPLESDVKERRLIRDACKDATLPVISVVCCALGIADFNASVRRFHIARVKNHLDFAYELEAQNVLLVIGEYVWQKEIITPAEQWNWAAIAVREVGDAGEVDDGDDLHIVALAERVVDPRAFVLRVARHEGHGDDVATQRREIECVTARIGGL